MFNIDMKMLIKFVVEKDIIDIRTFSGYKGGDILSIISGNTEVIIEIKNFCEKLEVSTNIKPTKYQDEFEIFCMFGTDRLQTDIHNNIYYDNDNSVYDLKEE